MVKKQKNNDNDKSASVFCEKTRTLSPSAAGLNEEAPGAIEKEAKSVEMSSSCRLLSFFNQIRNVK